GGPRPPTGPPSGGRGKPRPLRPASSSGGLRRRSTVRPHGSCSGSTKAWRRRTCRRSASSRPTPPPPRRTSTASRASRASTTSTRRSASSGSCGCSRAPLPDNTASRTPRATGRCRRCRPRVAEPLVVLVAAGDEEARIGTSVAALRRAFPEAEIVVADDGSHDATAEEAQRAGARVVSLPRLGKGQALTLAEREAPPGRLLLCDADL